MYCTKVYKCRVNEPQQLANSGHNKWQHGPKKRKPLEVKALKAQGSMLDVRQSGFSGAISPPPGHCATLHRK